MNKQNKNIAIIGGGILGLTLALRLRQKGHDVTIFEAAQEIGGLASAWQIGDITWDKFYHVILMSDLHTRGILKELHIEKDMQWRETKSGFYTDGKLYSMSNAIEFLQFPPLNLVDKIRLGMTIFMASKRKDWQNLEKVPVEQWLRSWSGNNTFEKIWLPLLRSKLGENYKNTSAAFIWATIQRMYAARQAGLKKEMFGYMPGSYATTLQKFEEKLVTEGVKIRTGIKVGAINRINNGLSIKLSDNKTEKFDQAIVTSPSPLAAQMCPDLSEEEKQKLNDIQYLGVVCASILLKKSLSPYYVTNITETWVPFTGVIEMSSLVDKDQFNGNALVYLPKYVTPDDPELNLADEEIRGKYLSALKKMHPDIQDEGILAFQVARARYVFALSTLGYSKNLPPMQTSVSGLYIINSAHIVNGTLNVNETVQLAEKAVGEYFK